MAGVGGIDVFMAELSVMPKTWWHRGIRASATSRHWIEALKEEMAS
jgi:hypothetical protein